MVHTACRPLHPTRCPLGPCRISIVPPIVLSTIGLTLVILCCVCHRVVGSRWWCVVCRLPELLWMSCDSLLHLIVSLVVVWDSLGNFRHAVIMLTFLDTRKCLCMKCLNCECKRLYSRNFCDVWDCPYCFEYSSLTVSNINCQGHVRGNTLHP